ncbi:hypothetical protein ACHAWF_007475 [Thalassiosira exigua]
MRAKKQREKGGAVEDALEAKIRKKAEAAASEAASRKSRERVEDLGEEKDDYDDIRSEDSDGFDESDRDGGGDVRTRPPPGAAGGPGGAQLDPLRQAELDTEKNKKDVNKRFADLHETGQWGGLSKWEKYGICVLILGAIAAAIVLGLKFGKPPSGPEVSERPTKSPTLPPSMSPTLSPTDEDYRIEEGLELMRDASGNLALPTTSEEVRGAKERPDSTPQALAAEYVLFDDPLALSARDPRFLERFALVSFYYANGGCAGDWITNANWMNDEDHCEGWHGVTCNLQGRVTEVSMSKNYVTGRMPVDFSGLRELSTLDLSNNAMEGTVPAKALSMPNVYTIQLNNNRLEGTFPFEDLKAGAEILDVLWIQENPQLTGRITQAYCQMSSITLDCDNFEPQPLYPIEPKYGDGLTTFEERCIDGVGSSPQEYTCNSDPPVPFEKPPSDESTVFGQVPAPAICGTPARVR